MLRNFVLGLTAAGFCAAIAGSTLADNRTSISKKGSLLIYSKVEIKWEADIVGGFPLVQDTVLDLSNDYPDDVNVQFYFVNGDPPLEQECDPACEFRFGFCADVCHVDEREHPGWNWVDCEVPLTANQPTYFSAATGYPAGCQPFTTLDPGFPPGRPDPEVQGGRILRGFVYAWAVKNDPADGQNVQIRWNHLVGDAAIINYRNTTSAEYNAYAFQVVERVGGPGNGDFVGTAGTLNLNGIEYDNAFERLVMDFYAANPRGNFDFDITLHPVSADLRQETEGPVKTKAVFDIWDENENRFSGTEKCIECWDQTLASNYPAPNHLRADVLPTTKGKARITGVSSNIPACPLAVDAALLGIQIKEFSFGRMSGMATSAISMVGQGEKAATIRYDIIDGSNEAQGVTGGATVGTAGLAKANRTGR